MKLSSGDYELHVEANDGLCLSCEAWKYGGVEPDATEYKCDACGENAVCCAEEAILMGDIEIEDE